MKIGYVSDLHMEFVRPYDFSKEEGGDVLILAGDIITAYSIASHRTDKEGVRTREWLMQFKKDVMDKYAHVFYVMGNHDHYNSVFNKTKSNLQESFKEMGLPIRIFDNDWTDVMGVNFIGCTLWADFEKEKPTSMLDCGQFMNDYRIIGAPTSPEGPKYYNRYDMRYRPVTPEATLNEHKSSVQYINAILNQQGNIPTVVFTHMAPTYVSLNKEHVGNGLDGAYASDLAGMIASYPQIKYWIHGHTHLNVNYDVGHTKVVANQRGYDGEFSWLRFSGIKHVEI